MSPFIKQLAVELGRKEEDVEKVWSDCKKVTADTFGIKEEDFSKREIEYTKEVVRETLGLRKEITVADFVKSDKSASEFIDEAITVSGQFGIDRAVTKKKKDDEKDEETEEKEEGVGLLDTNKFLPGEEETLLKKEDKE